LVFLAISDSLNQSESMLSPRRHGVNAFSGGFLNNSN